MIDTEQAFSLFLYNFVNKTLLFLSAMTANLLLFYSFTHVLSPSFCTLSHAYSGKGFSCNGHTQELMHRHRFFYKIKKKGSQSTFNLLEIVMNSHWTLISTKVVRKTQIRVCVYTHGRVCICFSKCMCMTVHA